MSQNSPCISFKKNHLPQGRNLRWAHFLVIMLPREHRFELYCGFPRRKHEFCPGTIAINGLQVSPTKFYHRFIRVFQEVLYLRTFFGSHRHEVFEALRRSRYLCWCFLHLCRSKEIATRVFIPRSMIFSNSGWRVSQFLILRRSLELNSNRLQFLFASANLFTTDETANFINGYRTCVVVVYLNSAEAPFYGETSCSILQCQLVWKG